LKSLAEIRWKKRAGISTDISGSWTIFRAFQATKTQ
jgi:hypothetical protein